MARNIFKGLGIALVTPFTADGEVDYKAIVRLVEYQIQNGADFLCILATTGETPCLSTEEKENIKKLVVDTNRGRLPILMGCGGNNTRAVVEELKTADWTGIDGVLSVCPYYNKPSQEGLYQHFKAIAEASPLPVVLYNVPGRTGINMKSETTVRLARDCENIVAVKEASGSLEQVDEIIKNKPERFDVLSGDDALTFSMVASGAAGSISVIGNALPKEVSRMIRLEFKGEYEAARTIHHRFTELYSLLFVDGNPAGVKALLHEMGFIENVLRLPLVPTRITTLQSLEQVDEIIKNKPERFDVLSGDDALTFSMVASGAAGSISVIGNALPKEVSRMIRLEFKGEYEAARTIHHRFTELYSLLFVDGNPAGVKALLHEMGFIENVLRLPLVPTRITTLQKMTEILKTLKI